MNITHATMSSPDDASDTSTYSQWGHQFSQHDISEATVIRTTAGRPSLRSCKLTNVVCRQCLPILLDSCYVHQARHDGSRYKYYEVAYKHARPRSCAFCNLILLWIRRVRSMSASSRYKGFSGDLEISTDVFEEPAVRSGTLHIRTAEFRGNDSSFLEIKQCGSGESDVALRSLPRVRRYFDRARIRTWLSQSATKDALLAPSASAAILFSAGFRLVDCLHQCIVRLHTPCDYLALSYVWGVQKSLWLQVCKENEQDLSRPHGLLLKRASGARLPHIVREAIELSSVLGFRYLWVDSLCILQDDERDKARLIARMDEIYHSAYATICIPHCTGADDRIPGLFNKDRIRMISNST